MLLFSFLPIDIHNCGSCKVEFLEEFCVGCDVTPVYRLER